MKFTVSSSSLLSLLATTGKVISNKNTLPILDYFLMELKGDELTVTTSDLETTIIGHLKVESVEREGVIAAPAKLMLDSLKEFPEMPLEFDVNDTTWEIKVKWASGSLSIPGASAVSYPAMPAIGAECKDILLDVDMLIAGINKTIFATADDELRPVMNGVYFNFEQGKLTFVATDAHKLVRSMVECPDVDFNASFILPKKPANLLKGMLVELTLHIGTHCTFHHLLPPPSLTDDPVPRISPHAIAETVPSVSGQQNNRRLRHLLWLFSSSILLSYDVFFRNLLLTKLVKKYSI